jgi:hypothetical protein
MAAAMCAFSDILISLRFFFYSVVTDWSFLWFCHRKCGNFEKVVPEEEIVISCSGGQQIR